MQLLGLALGGSVVTLMPDCSTGMGKAGEGRLVSHSRKSGWVSGSACSRATWRSSSPIQDCARWQFCRHTHCPAPPCTVSNRVQSASMYGQQPCTICHTQCWDQLSRRSQTWRSSSPIQDCANWQFCRHTHCPAPPCTVSNTQCWGPMMMPSPDMTFRLSNL